MPVDLLQTKLVAPPLRPALVPRPRLLEQLDQGMALNSKLTLISAPAGFGKTTLIADWGLRLTTPGEASTAPPTPHFCWLSLDEEDNDPQRFFTYLITALQKIDGLGQEGQGLLQSPLPAPPRSQVTALINDCAAIAGPIVLVLDDYHVITAEPVNEALTLWLENLPANMHLVINTRTDPLLPLSRLRARGQMTEIRIDDLRFTLQESARFLKKTMGVSLSDEDIAALEERTEGWVAGLQMAALSLQGFQSQDDIESFVADFTGSHRYIFDYLADEVLQHQPAHIRDFLRQSSILDQMCGPLCDAVMGYSQGQSGQTAQEILLHLDASNVFTIALDNERRWYRYHHLFADQLRHRLRVSSPDQVSGLHLRASVWYEENGMVIEAIGHALKAEDLLRTARLIEGSARQWLANSELGLLLRWLSPLPDELIRARPNLGLYKGWTLALVNHFDQVEPVLQGAEDAYQAALKRPETLPDHGLGTPEERGTFQGYLATCWAALARSRFDIPRGIELLQQALAYFPEDDLAGRGVATLYLGYALWMAGDVPGARQTFELARQISQAGGQILSTQSAMDALGKILLELGELQEAYRLHQRALKMAEEHTRQTGQHLPGIGLAHNGLAAVLYEWNELKRAQEHASRGVELFKPWGVTENLLDSYNTLARLRLAEGDTAGALELAQTAVSLVEEPRTPDWLQAMIAARQARLLIMAQQGQTGGLTTVSNWVESAGLDPKAEPGYQREVDNIILARILLQQSELDQALPLLERLYQGAAAGARQGRVIEILILTALARQDNGNPAGALSALEQALALAKPEGYVRAFVDEGRPMFRLLTQAAVRGISPAYVSQILAAFSIPDGGERAAQQPLFDPLSRRELEVLGLMAAGLSGPQIAGRLYLSANTIKTHVRNIYSKLNVNSRAEALTVARSLDLLP